MAVVRCWSPSNEMLLEFDSCHVRRAMVVSAPISQVTLHATLPVSSHYDATTMRRLGPVEDTEINAHLGHLQWPLIKDGGKKVAFFSMADDVLHAAVEYVPSRYNPKKMRFRRATIDLDFGVLAARKTDCCCLANVIVWSELLAFSGHKRKEVPTTK